MRHVYHAFSFAFLRLLRTICILLSFLFYISLALHVESSNANACGLIYLCHVEPCLPTVCLPLAQTVHGQIPEKPRSQLVPNGQIHRNVPLSLCNSLPLYSQQPHRYSFSYLIYLPCQAGDKSVIIHSHTSQTGKLQNSFAISYPHVHTVHLLSTQHKLLRGCPNPEGEKNQPLKGSLLGVNKSLQKLPNFFTLHFLNTLAVDEPSVEVFKMS